MPPITAPTFNSYADFKASDWYQKVMTRNGVEYIFYEETPGVENMLLPITKGENISWTNTMEKFPIDEWGQSVIREFGDGKFTISGTVGIFYSPAQSDTLPTTQDFVGRRFKIVKRVAAGYPGAGIPLHMLDGVALNSKDYSSARGPIRFDVRFVASREYSGDELEAMGYK